MLRFKQWLVAIGLALGLSTSVQAQMLPMNIPDLCSAAGSTIIAAGDNVTYTGAHSATCLGVHGTLTLANNSTLTVNTLLVYPDGALKIGTAASPAVDVTVIFRDVPLQTVVADPEEWDHGFINTGSALMYGQPKTVTFSRVTTELVAGATTISTEDNLTGWLTGDRIVVPDSRQVDLLEGWNHPAGQIENLVVQSVGTNSVTIPALGYNHPGGRNSAGVLVHLPHIMNVSRSIIFKSENPLGTRGHVTTTHSGRFISQYVEYDDLGRTTVDPIGPGNLIGRYGGPHIHKNYGPSPAVDPYQFIVVGNAVNHGRKWGIIVHNSSYGLIQDNTVWDTNGASYMFEDGSESFNLVNRNISIQTTGLGGREGGGREGVGFYFRGPNNTVTNNVSSGAYSGPNSSFGYKYFATYLGDIRVPNAPGSDTTISGQYTLHNGNNMPIDFHNNEVYGADSGITYWWLGAFGQDGGYPDAPEQVIDHLVTWNLSDTAVLNYPSKRITIRDLVMHETAGPCCVPTGFNGGDYDGDSLRIENPDISNAVFCIEPSWWSRTPQTIVGGDLTCTINYVGSPLYTSNYTPDGIPPITVNIIGTRFHRPTIAMTGITGGNAWDIFRIYSTNPVVTTIRPNTVHVVDYNGVAGDNFDVFLNEQAPDFVVPQSVIRADNTVAVEGAPVAELTNTQTLAQYNIAISGSIAPCSTVRQWIKGFTCGAVVVPQPPVTPSGPTPTSGATEVSLTTALSWTATGATTVAVKFGTVNPPPTVVASQAGSSYSPAALVYSTVYYWQIVATNAVGSTSGPVWSFTTLAQPVDPVDPTIPSGALGNYNFSAVVNGSILNRIAGGAALPPLIMSGTDYSTANGELTLNEHIVNPIFVFPFDPTRGTFLTSAAFPNSFQSGTIGMRMRLNHDAATTLGQASGAGVLTFRPEPDINNASYPPRDIQYDRWFAAEPIMVSAHEGLPTAGATGVSHQDVVQSGPIPDAEQYVTVIMVWDATTLRLYVNGVLAQTLSPRETLDYPTSSYKLWLGAQTSLIHSGDRQFMQGTIRGLMVYNRVLTNGELSQLNVALDSGVIVPPPPVAPGTPTSPSPANQSIGASLTPTLTWSATGATTYDVKFGTTNPPNLVAVDLTTASFSPTPMFTLTPGSNYFWQVIAKGNGLQAVGPVWSFATASPLPPTPPVGCVINFDATVAADGTVTLKVKSMTGCNQ